MSTLDNPTLDNVFSGFLNSVSPWDLSIIAIGIAGSLDSFYLEHHIKFPEWEFDQRISDSIARNDGRLSLGSRVSPDALSWTVVLSQLAVTGVLDEFTGLPVTSYDYAKGFMFAKAVLLNMYITEFVKSAVFRERPDGTDGRSFFSGHASSIFTFTSYLYREIDDWVDSAFPRDDNRNDRTLAKCSAFTILYGWACYVGFSRIYDKRHYLTDVLVGSVVGATVGNVMYSSFATRLGSKTATFELTAGTEPSILFTLQL